MPNIEAPLSEPLNKNLALQSRFRVVIQKLPHISYFTKTIAVPGINVGEVQYPTPFMDLIIAGDKVIYDPLIVTFNVDEDFRAWEETYNWMTGITFPHDFSQYRKLVGQNAKTFMNVYGDATLLIQTSAQNTHLAFRLQNVFPISLGAVQFDAGTDGVSNLSCDLTLRFTYMEFVRDFVTT